MKSEQIELYHQAGFNIFSIDYRLAPESKLPAMKEDIADALHWVENEGAKQFDYDPEKIAVIGSSAGGFLALLTGIFTNKPKAIVSFYGYGDIIRRLGIETKSPLFNYDKCPKGTCQNACVKQNHFSRAN